MRRYVCLKCGWNWEVEAYHEENESPSAAEEKFTLFPQILKGDIVRVVGEFSKEESCHVVSAVRDAGVYSEYPHYHYNEEIVAVYRFDGRDFKCIWESLRYKLDRFEESAAEVSTAIKNLRANVTSVTAAVQLMAQNAKEAKGKASE